MYWYRGARGLWTEIAALSVQGPNAREVLRQACDADLDKLKYFRITRTKFDGGIEGLVSRTGYTGDLGYEVWVANDDALGLWDALIDAGEPYGLTPAGLDAMDVTRIEAGFILNGIDYFSAIHSLIDPRKASPYELSLGWAVHLKRDPFRPISVRKAGPRRDGTHGSDHAHALRCRRSQPKYAWARGRATPIIPATC